MHIMCAGLNNHCLVMFAWHFSFWHHYANASDVRRQQLGILPDSANRQGRISRRYRTNGYKWSVPSEKIDCHQKQPFNANQRCASLQVALRTFQVPKTCQTHPLHDRQGDFFVKMARRPAAAMFQGEALGLEALRAAGWRLRGTSAKKLAILLDVL